MTAPAHLPDRDRLLELIVELAVVHGKVTLSSGPRGRLVHRHAPADPAPRGRAAGRPRDAPADRRPPLRRRRRPDPGRRPGGDGDAARRRRRRGLLDACVVRKAGKAHGLQRRIEGPDVAGRAVLVVEDVSTTGGSPLTAAEALQEAGAEVIARRGDRRPGRARGRRGGRLRVPRGVLPRRPRAGLAVPPSEAGSSRAGRRPRSWPA